MRTPFPTLASAFLFSSLSLPLLAQQSGDFTYSSCGGAVTITNYTGSGGAVSVPATIAGQPVTRLANEAFHSSASVTQVTLPSSLTYIGRGTFAHCTGLTSVSFGSGLTTIDYSAFYRCTSLTGVNLPSSLTTLGEAAFRDCAALSTITLPSDITTLATNTFNGCSSLTDVTFPESLTSIDLGAFYNCSSLTSATFMGNAPTTFGSLVFTGTASDFKILYHKNKTGFTSPLWNGYAAFPIEFTYVIKAGSVYITGYTGTGGPVSVPAKLAGLPVTRINSEAFHAGITPGNTNITGIVLPDTVTYIGAGAFAGCSGLTSMGLGSGLTTIDHSAFYACSGLTAITIPASVTTIQHTAFGLTSLTEATFVGNAPATFAQNIFPPAPADFTVYYYAGKTGFSQPQWKGYPAVELGGTHGSIEAWRSRHFGTIANAGIAADNADPDHDGISNLAEYAFNLDPRSGTDRVMTASTGIKGRPLTTAGQQDGLRTLTTEFVRRKGSGNLRYTMQYSADLSPGWMSSTFAATSVTPIDADWERVVYRVGVTAPHTRMFARVMVER